MSIQIGSQRFATLRNTVCSNKRLVVQSALQQHPTLKEMSMISHAAKGKQCKTGQWNTLGWCVTSRRRTFVTPRVLNDGRTFVQPIQCAPRGKIADSCLRLSVTWWIHSFDMEAHQCSKCHRRLGPLLRNKAQVACDYLMNSPLSPYTDFVKKHEHVLEGRCEQTVSDWELLQPSIVCALWPTLYWGEAWCDSRWSFSRSKKSARRSFFCKTFTLRC